MSRPPDAARARLADNSSPMMIAESTVHIARRVEEVFAFVADPANESSWHTDVTQVRREAEGPLSHGETFVWEVAFMGRSDYTLEVTGFEPQRRIELTTRSGSMKPRLTHRFEPANGGTHYTRHLAIPLEGPYRLTAPIMRRVGPKKNARFATNLKNILEEPPHVQPPRT